jgi:hypothetical protein
MDVRLLQIHTTATEGGARATRDVRQGETMKKQRDIRLSEDEVQKLALGLDAHADAMQTAMNIAYMHMTQRQRSAMADERVDLIELRGDLWRRWNTAAPAVGTR